MARCHLKCYLVRTLPAKGPAVVELFIVCSGEVRYKLELVKRSIYFMTEHSRVFNK
jgi:hypothetical protein